MAHMARMDMEGLTDKTDKMEKMEKMDKMDKMEKMDKMAGLVREEDMAEMGETVIGDVEDMAEMGEMLKSWNECPQWFHPIYRMFSPWKNPESPCQRIYQTEMFNLFPMVVGSS